MDIDSLNERLVTLNEQLEYTQTRMNQAIADLNAINGAIQEITFWIDKLKT